MEWYYSKADLLRNLGKNCKDTKLIDRMIARGEVESSRGRYRVVCNDTVENTTISGGNMKSIDSINTIENTTLAELKEELYVARVNKNYYQWISNNIYKRLEEEVVRCMRALGMKEDNVDKVKGRIKEGCDKVRVEADNMIFDDK